MKLYNILLAIVTLVPAAAAHAQARTSTLMSCRQVGGTRTLRIDAAQEGVLATVSGRRGAILGESDHEEQSFTFKVGDWHDANFLSLEVKRVNSRYIGVLFEPTRHQGPEAHGAYDETVFACAEIFQGSATSSGG